MRIIAAIVLLCASASTLAEISAWVPIDTSSGQVIIPITLNGEPARALLNTGSNGNMVSQAFLDAHEGEYSVGQGATVTGGSGSYRSTMINDMTLGIFGTEFEIDQLASGYFDNYDLMIGLPFFELFVVQIDYPGQRMRIMDHGSINMKKLANVKMRREGGSGSPQVRVEMNGDVKAWLKLSTGNSGPLIYGRANAERRGWLEDYRVDHGEDSGTNDDYAGIDLFRLPTITIGPFEMEDVLVGVTSGDYSVERTRRDTRTTGFRLQKGGKKRTDGTLGFDILQHYIVTIDMRRNRLNLDVPRPEPEAP